MSEKCGYCGRFNRTHSWSCSKEVADLRTQLKAAEEERDNAMSLSRLSAQLLDTECNRNKQLRDALETMVLHKKYNSFHAGDKAIFLQMTKYMNENRKAHQGVYTAYTWRSAGHVAEKALKEKP